MNLYVISRNFFIGGIGAPGPEGREGPQGKSAWTLSLVLASLFMAHLWPSYDTLALTYDAQLLVFFSFW